MGFVGSTNYRRKWIGKKCDQRKQGKHGKKKKEEGIEKVGSEERGPGVCEVYWVDGVECGVGGRVGCVWNALTMTQHLDEEREREVWDGRGMHLITRREVS